MRLLWSAGLALLFVLLDPVEVWAWGPGTHVALGEGLLSSLHLLPTSVALLLRRYPIHFLYGSVAADISFGKKYAPEGRHCHSWHVGEEILSQADTDALRATSYGYLSHLAADTIAHNFFVPRKLLLTKSTQGLGHTYWEMRMDSHVGESFMSRARRLVWDYDHSAADTLFDTVLSHTVFSFQTNRKIFRGMVRMHDNDTWKRVFERVLSNSSYDLPPARVSRYLSLSFDYVVDYLNRRGGSLPAALDPIGDLNLRLAKQFRRGALSRSVPSTQDELQRAADEFFKLPEAPDGYWDQIEVPT